MVKEPPEWRKNFSGDPDSDLPAPMPGGRYLSEVNRLLSAENKWRPKRNAVFTERELSLKLPPNSSGENDLF